MAGEAGKTVRTKTEKADKEELVLVFYENAEEECFQVLDVRTKTGELQLKAKPETGRTRWITAQSGDVIYIPERRKTRLPAQPIIESTQPASDKTISPYKEKMYLQFIAGGLAGEVVRISRNGHFLVVSTVDATREQVTHFLMQPGDVLTIGKPPEAESQAKAEPAARAATQAPVSVGEAILAGAARQPPQLGDVIRAQIAANLQRASESGGVGEAANCGYEIWKYGLPRINESRIQPFSSCEHYSGGFSSRKLILYAVLCMPLLISTWIIVRAYVHYVLIPSSSARHHRFDNEISLIDEYNMVETYSTGTVVRRRGDYVPGSGPVETPVAELREPNVDEERHR